MDQLRGFIKPPFANYDVVVYFGGGLFALPFVYRYLLSPLQLEFPTFELSIGNEILATSVAVLTTLFVIYVFGHLIAYCGSQFIEKFIDRIFGKVSSAIFVSSRVQDADRNDWIRALIYDRFKSINRDGAKFTTGVRALLHLPVAPLYAGVFALGIFGYYATRIPYFVLHRAGQKFKNEECLDGRISLRSKWYKPLEYFVINRYPAAVARMYNYLVISGLFRTLATVFLFSIWMQVYYAIHFFLDADWMLEPFLGYYGPLAGFSEYMATAMAYCFCLFSYLKFQRRYAEEAIFAFVFEESGANCVSITHDITNGANS